MKPPPGMPFDALTIAAEAAWYFTECERQDGVPEITTPFVVVWGAALHPCDDLPYLVGIYAESEPLPAPEPVATVTT